MPCIDRSRLGNQDISLQNIVVTSGVRGAGRTVNNQIRGRVWHGLLYIWDGTVCFHPDNGPTLQAGSGALLYIPKDLHYVMQYTREGTTFVLINFEMLSPEGERLYLSESVCILAEDEADHRIAGIMAKLERCSASENLSAVFRRKELVYRLLSQIYRDDVPLPDEYRHPKFNNIIPGVLLLQQSYLENVPISALALACGISVSSFRALFTEQYGLSPIQYRNRLRISRAQYLLGDGNCTVAEAAYASGFDNIGYFCRYYKKITGEAPRETRRRGFSEENI